MRINRKYLIRCTSTHKQEEIDEFGDVLFNRFLSEIAQSMQEGDNFKQEIYKTFAGDMAFDISCVVLHPDVFRRMVEKIDYHDPYFMDMVLPDLSTIEQ